MTQAKTAGNSVTSPGEGMTDRDLLLYVAQQVEDLCESVSKRLDHSDEIAHDVQRQVGEITATLAQHKPLLERYQALSDPGSAVRSWLSGKGKGKA